MQSDCGTSDTMDRLPAPAFVPPETWLAIGVTGHRAAHEGFSAAEDAIAATLSGLLDAIERASLARGPVRRRMLTLLADGTDSMAAGMAIERGYELVAPLPFGRRLNRAINSLTADPAEARALLAGEDGAQDATRAHAARIRALTDSARVFGLADADERITALFLASFDAPADDSAAQLFRAESSRRVALAGRILVEQSDILLAVWDGVTTAHVGGTGDTIVTALELGVPVVWIDPANPSQWRLLARTEQLALPESSGSPDDRGHALAELVEAVLDPGERDGAAAWSALGRERWRNGSTRFGHAYRRIEALFGRKRWRDRFGGLTKRYPRPDDTAKGSARAMLDQVRALPGAEGLADQIEQKLVRRFAWVDSVADRLSDAYRGGMTVSFVLSSLAVVAGVGYLPFGDAVPKWLFALVELGLLTGILLLIAYGVRRHLHNRWFETRRLAEYLRHAPLLAIAGTARPVGRWPRGMEVSWPEFAARQIGRETGLPRLVVTGDYLRRFLAGPLSGHVADQAAYHRDKAARLGRVHHGLDRFALRCFQLAVASVAIYLGWTVSAKFGLVGGMHDKSAKIFTVLGVAFPTLGAGLAGIRYFGDFQRFGEISATTAEKLETIADRIALLLRAPDGRWGYGEVAEIVRATDEAVIGELESWQGIFRGKHVSVPV